MLAADDIVAPLIVGNARIGIAADRNLMQVFERDLLDLIDFRSAQVADDNAGLRVDRHGNPLTVTYPAGTLLRHISFGQGRR